MAFVQKISEGNTVNEGAEIIYVADLTGNIGETSYKKDPNTSDTYIGTVNVTGYGAPNATRSSIALFLVAYIKKTTGDVFIPVNSNNPLTVNKFEVVRKEDGWYNFNLISMPAVNTPLITDYTEGNLVYNTSDNKIYEKKSGVFVNILIADLHKYIGGVYSVASSEKAVIIANTITLNKNIDQKNDLIFAGRVDVNGIRRYQEVIDLYDGFIRGACNEYRRANKMIFQRNVEYMNNNLLNCDC